MAYEYAHDSGFGLAGALIAEAARLKMTRNGQPMLSLEQAHQLGSQVAGNLVSMRNMQSPLGRMVPAGASLGEGLTSFLPGQSGEHPMLEYGAQAAGIPDSSRIRTSSNLWLAYDQWRVGMPERGIPSIGDRVPFGRTVEERLDGFLRGVGADLQPIDVEPPGGPSAGRIFEALHPRATEQPPEGLGH